METILWRKHGLIIDPATGPAWRRHMSGAVHVLPWGDGLYRVYLTGVGEDSPTILGEPGRRAIGYLELDRDFNIVAECPRNPLLTAGQPGDFDCDGVVMPIIVRLSPTELYMYYAGFGPGLGSCLDNHMGLAISRDNGETWTRWSRAPLPVRDNHDPSCMGTFWPIRERPDHWRIWYTAPSHFEETPTINKVGWQWRVFTHIKYATSRDGIHWDKPADNVVLPLEANEELLTRPMVIKEPDGYRMWFSLKTRDRPYIIGYAESPDGLQWRRKPAGLPMTPGSWDSDQLEYAFVLKEADRYLMFYNGNGFGRTGTGLAIGTTAPV